MTVTIEMRDKYMSDGFHFHHVTESHVEYRNENGEKRIDVYGTGGSIGGAPYSRKHIIRTLDGVEARLYESLKWESPYHQMSSFRIAQVLFGHTIPFAEFIILCVGFILYFGYVDSMKILYSIVASAIIAFASMVIAGLIMKGYIHHRDVGYVHAAAVPLIQNHGELYVHSLLEDLSKASCSSKAAVAREMADKYL